MNKLIVAVLAALMVAGCSDGDQAEKDRQARKEREFNETVRKQREEQEQLDRQMREPSAPQEPEEPAAPPEPQYEELEWYYFTSSTEKTPVKCLEREAETCGERFTKCDNNNTYSCQVSVKYFTKTEKRLVIE